MTLTLPIINITIPLIAALIILLAFLFDFYNGMHDAANSIATVVATKVLTPLQAVTWAACFNFIALFLFGLGVAATIGKGLIDISVIDNTVIMAALIGAIIVAAGSTHLGIPLSISHCLIGGLGGVAVMKAGFSALIANGFLKVIGFIFISPLLGYLFASLFSIATIWLVKNMAPGKVDKYFRKLQVLSAGLYSLSHGSNDAQKTIGLITMVLITNKIITPAARPPYWVELTSYSVIALGTMLGGWKVIKTLGMRMTKLTPLHDRILVSRIEESTTTRGGIIIPDSAKDKPQEGEVIAVGRGKSNDKGEVFPLAVKKGDHILFGKYAGTEIKIDGEEFLIMREEEVLGILEPVAAGVRK